MQTLTIKHLELFNAKLVVVVNSLEWDDWDDYFDNDREAG